MVEYARTSREQPRVGHRRDKAAPVPSNSSQLSQLSGIQPGRVLKFSARHQVLGKNFQACPSPEDHRPPVGCLKDLQYQDQEVERAHVLQDHRAPPDCHGWRPGLQEGNQGRRHVSGGPCLLIGRRSSLHPSAGLLDVAHARQVCVGNVQCRASRQKRGVLRRPRSEPAEALGHAHDREWKQPDQHARDVLSPGVGGQWPVDVVDRHDQVRPKVRDHGGKLQDQARIGVHPLIHHRLPLLVVEEHPHCAPHLLEHRPLAGERRLGWHPLGDEEFHVVNVGGNANSAAGGLQTPGQGHQRLHVAMGPVADHEHARASVQGRLCGWRVRRGLAWLRWY
mmetsp:Transcript_107790/g.322389  ORF Transcript_107790/g.322389 Transcript_107790/m.322389 type:complete len:336 (-) Transcript_107790:31-1038(-)